MLESIWTAPSEGGADSCYPPGEKQTRLTRVAGRLVSRLAVTSASGCCCLSCQTSSNTAGCHVVVHKIQPVPITLTLAD